MTSIENEHSVLIAAIEGGGTTFVVSIARLYLNNDDIPERKPTMNVDVRDESMELLENTTISSSVPHETLEKCCAWLSSKRPQRNYQSNQKDGFAAVGIACFGPLGVDTKNKTTCGRILESSPKKEWRNVDIVTPIIKACSSDLQGSDPPPFLLDTDVNAPALAEFERSSKTKPISSLAYVTVGTGVGVGLIVNSKPVHGMMHPEGGHICVSPLSNDSFQGYSWGKQRSPYGGVHTVEGIASSVALTERLISSSLAAKDNSKIDRDDLALLSDYDEVWDHAANAIANLCVSLILLLSMEEIVLGGGIMKRKILYEKIRSRTKEIINGYVSLPEGESSLRFIREPTWGNSAGLVGALTLAKSAFEKKRREVNGVNPKKNIYANVGTSLKSQLSPGVMVTSLLALVAILGQSFYAKRK